MSVAKSLIGHVLDGTFRPGRHAGLLETDDGLLAFADRRGFQPWEDFVSLLAFLQREYRAEADPERRYAVLLEFGRVARS